MHNMVTMLETQFAKERKAITLYKDTIVKLKKELDLYESTIGRLKRKGLLLRATTKNASKVTKERAATTEIVATARVLADYKSLRTSQPKSLKGQLRPNNSASRIVGLK